MFQIIQPSLVITDRLRIFNDLGDEEMKNYMQIGNRKIGEDYAPLVIAEIGINHEGSLKTAFENVFTLDTP